MPGRISTNTVPMATISAIRHVCHGNYREFYHRHGPTKTKYPKGPGGDGSLSCSIVTFYRAMGGYPVSEYTIGELTALCARLSLTSKDGGEKAAAELLKESVGVVLALLRDYRETLDPQKLYDLFTYLDVYGATMVTSAYPYTDEDLQRIIESARKKQKSLPKR